jgi:hypothetical protein
MIQRTRTKVLGLGAWAMISLAITPGCDLGIPGDGGARGSAGAGGNGGAGGAVDQQALLEEELSDDQTGGVTCTSPTDCVNKCVAEAKYCWAEHAVHPYKPDQTGDLYQCIDTFPKAKYGGSYTCLYK